MTVALLMLAAAALGWIAWRYLRPFAVLVRFLYRLQALGGHGDESYDGRAVRAIMDGDELIALVEAPAAATPACPPKSPAPPGRDPTCRVR